MRALIRVPIAVLACYGAGLLGSIFVSTQMNGWYDALIKPSYMPEAWLFAPVWFVLYGLMAAALVIIWNKDPHAHEVRGWVPFFFAHLLLNAAWTIFFFGFNAVFVALIDIVILGLIICFLIAGAWEIDRRAAYLLSPYFAWVAFAAVLNASIWYLN